VYHNFFLFSFRIIIRKFVEYFENVRAPNNVRVIITVVIRSKCPRVIERICSPIRYGPRSIYVLEVTIDPPIIKLNKAYCLVRRRCLIPECDPVANDQVIYKPIWLNRSVPFDDNRVPEKCSRYAMSRSYYSVYNNTNNTKHQCQYYNFNRTLSVECDEFVFESDGETTIVSAVSATDRANDFEPAASTRIPAL